MLATKIAAAREIEVTLLFDNHGPSIEMIPGELERCKGEENTLKGNIRSEDTTTNGLQGLCVNAGG